MMASSPRRPRTTRYRALAGGAGDGADRARDRRGDRFSARAGVTALAAWTLQRLSQGRFTLGLGSQVKGHIERRYGMAWTPPGPWMRDYVGALRAIWACWQNGGTKLHYR